MRKNIFSILPICFALLLSCRNQPSDNQTNHSDSTITGKLIVFHAGSLSVPLKEISLAFNKEYPGVEVLMEAAGSLASARKLTELGQICDIIAVSDYKVIDNMLIPDYCQWNIPFAGNEMIIAYTSKSNYSDQISVNNWFEILSKNDVSFGRSDPNSDPCGYRTIMTFQLADIYYNKMIYNKLSWKDKKYIRPKETDLLALLESREIDYVFIYRSVAIQHHLDYLVLPDSINMKNPQLADFYSQASLQIDGSSPGEKQEVVGEPMIYGISIPKNAPNKHVAEAFLSFLLSPEKGLRIMEKNGQDTLGPIENKNIEKMPEKIKKFALP